MPSDNPKFTVAENLRRLLEHAREHGGRGGNMKSSGKLARLGASTIKRMLEAEVAVNLDTLDAVANAYGLQAWQLLVPDFDPAAPPMMPTTLERALLVAMRPVIQETIAVRSNYPDDTG